MKLFSKPVATPARLPSGSFTIDRSGRVLVGTVPSTVPPTTVQEIGHCVLAAFREAQAAQLPLAELVVRFGSLKIVARELRGGAIVFLSPENPITAATSPT